jgi:phospholipase/lecithinase/hemolysin
VPRTGRTRNLFLAAAAAASFALAVPSAALASVSAIGVAGDSLSDEYRFYAGGRSEGRNYVELLSAFRGVSFGEHTSGFRPEPRNQGFAFDWARSGASSDDLIAAGQHAGLAAHAAAGEIDLAVLFVGGNDFRNALTSPNPAAALQQAPTTLITNLGVAVQTLLASNPTLNVIVTNVPDIGYTPQVRQLVQLGVLPQAVVDQVAGVIDLTNAGIASTFAGNPRVALLDSNGLLDQLMSGPNLTVDGLVIDRDAPSTDPDHFWIDPIHPGTIGHAYLANQLMGVANASFGAQLVPFTAAEIRAAAVPEPIAALLVLAPMTIGVRSRRFARR